jgi:hypothetical protein
MTEIANFDIAQHLKVEMFLPLEADNLFIIGVSQIGGDDVLGSSTSFIIGTSLIGSADVLSDNALPGFAWQEYEASTVQAEIELGGTIQNSLYFQPEPGAATITFQGFDLDPSVNKSIRPGAKIRVRLVAPGVESYLFNGFVDSIDVTYGSAGNNWNTIRVRAYDSHKRLMNSRVATYNTTGYHGGSHATPLEAITTAVNAAGFAMSASSQVLNHKLPTESETDIIIGPKILDAIKTGLGVFWIEADTQRVKVIDRPSIITSPPAGTYTVGNNHGDPYHLCMSDISVRADNDVTFNSLRVANSNDPNEYVVKIDQDNIDLYGIFALDVDINTTPDGQLVKWADEVFAQNPTKIVNQVTTPAVDRLGTLTGAAFLTPGTPLGVKYTKSPLLIDDYYTITKISHSIDVNNWATTMELWKEF